MGIQRIRTKTKVFGFLIGITFFIGIANTMFLVERVGNDFDLSELLLVGFVSAFVMMLSGCVVFSKLRRNQK